MTNTTNQPTAGDDQAVARVRAFLDAWQTIERSDRDGRIYSLATMTGTLHLTAADLESVLQALETAGHKPPGSES